MIIDIIDIIDNIMIIIDKYSKDKYDKRKRQP